jgi:hypothetical protein
MKKIITVAIIMAGLSLQAYDIRQYDMGKSQTNNQSSGYQGSSGNRYQYDMSNGNDRAAYSTDTGAQQRDYYNNMYNTSGNVQQDRSNGQFGGGIYGND